MSDRYYCNFGRCEDQSYISIGFDTLEKAEDLAEKIADAPVINISVTEQALYKEVFTK